MTDNGSKKSSVAGIFSEAAEKKLKDYMDRYPDRKSAVMPGLYIAQEEQGYISEEAIVWLAERLGMAPVHVREVASFYTMYYKNPVGKYHIQVCRTLSCAVRGSKELMECLHNRLKVPPHKTTDDGMWSYEAVECLGSCGTAPMCEINDRYFENLTPQILLEIISRIENEQPDLRFSATRDELGNGLDDIARSQILTEK